MDSEINQLQPEKRNPISQRRHRRETWWQIWFPLLLAIAAVGFGVNYLLDSGAGNTESVSQIATMMLVLPLLVIGIILLVLLGGLIYGIASLMNWLPPNAFWLQRQIQRINHRVLQATNIAAEPILRLESWSSALRRVFRK
jgi:predicted PurR-regulated permease PerM